MRRFGLAALAAIAPLNLGSVDVKAQETAATALPYGVTALGPVTVAQSDRYRFESRHVGKAFLVDVIRIDAPLAPPAPRLPVVFVPDGNVMTTLIPAIANLASLESLPSMIVVGISYDFGAASPQEARLQGFARRFTDFTPSTDEESQTLAMAVTEQLFGMAWPDDAPFGRADAFLAFIEEELKPFIAARYSSADVDDGTLFGHSLGGLFALHVLFTSPESFRRYIALDPTPWGDALAREEAALGDVSAHLFLGVSGALPPSAPAGSPTPADLTAALDEQIRNSARQGLRYTYTLYQDETHNSVPAVGAMTGLRTVLGLAPTPSSIAAPPGASPEPSSL